MSMYTHILFDLDGTLIESWPKLLRTINLFCQVEGQPVTADYMQEQYQLGKSLRIFLQEHNTSFRDMSRNEISNLFWNRYMEDSSSPELMPGVKTFLDQLQKNNMIAGVVTNKRQDVAKTEIENTPAFSKMSYVIGSGTGLKSKPNPDMILKAIEVLGASPEKTLFIGDSSQDFFAAKAAGIQVKLISCGNVKKHVNLVNIAGEAFVVNSYSEIFPRIIER